MLRTLAVIWPLTLGLALIPSASHVVSQEDGCEWLSAAESFYTDAMDLMQTLVNRGVQVRCVLGPSTSSGMFDGERGAAIFTTNLGNFDVHFLPPSLAFDGLVIKERIDLGRYLYSFEGTPKAWRANSIDSARAIHFIKSRNRLVETQDAATADRLASVLNTR